MLTVTHADRVAVLILFANVATIAAGIAAIVAAVQAQLSEKAFAAAVVGILFGMFLLQERLILMLLMWRGFVCNECRTRSVVEDSRRALRGYRCTCQGTAAAAEPVA